MKKTRIQFLGRTMLIRADSFTVAFLNGMSTQVDGRVKADQSGLTIERENSDSVQYVPWSSVRSVAFERAGKFALAEEARIKAEEEAAHKEAERFARADKRRKRQMERDGVVSMWVPAVP